MGTGESDVKQTKSPEEEALLAKNKALCEEALDFQCKIIDMREQNLPSPIERIRARCKFLGITDYEPILEEAAPHLNRLYIARCPGLMTKFDMACISSYYVSYQWDDKRITCAYPYFDRHRQNNNWKTVFVTPRVGSSVPKCSPIFQLPQLQSQGIERRLQCDWLSSNR